MSGQRPLTLLESSVDSIVLVKLRGNRQLRGTLYGFDVHMNLILTDSDEIIESQDVDEANTITSTPIPRGTIIVRGDNVILIAPSPR